MLTHERPPGEALTKFRRLLVAVDVSSPSLETLDDLAALASRLEVELQGLIVEDTDLLALAGHRVVTTFSTRAGLVLDSKTIERTIRRHVDAARRAIESAALRRQVRATFEVRRGRTVLELIRSAERDDLLVVSRHASSFASIGTTRDSTKPGAGSTAQDILRNTQQSVFILGSVESLKGPLYPVFDGTPSSTHALELATKICARSKDKPLVVLLWATDPTDEKELQRSAQRVVARHDVLSSYKTVAANEGNGAATLCASLAANREEGILVLSGGQDVAREGAVQDVLKRVGCSVLLLR